MHTVWQFAVNAVLYGFLCWLFYNSTIREPDPWFAFVVAFVLVLAVIISVIPGLRAKGVSPGEFPYDDE
jgi:hypothetical protein